MNTIWSRNVLEYFVWRTVQQRLPELLAAIESETRSPSP
jgi:hypothetical protein